MRISVFVLVVTVAAAASAQTVLEAVRHDTTPAAVRDVPVAAADEPLDNVRVEHRVRPIPFPRPTPGKPRAAAEAPAAPSNAQLTLVTEPFFTGVGADSTPAYTIRHAPPDTTGAVGTTQYVQWVNNAFAVFDKTGKVLLPARDGQTIWSGFDGKCGETNDGDPIVLFDKTAKRWLMSQFAVQGDGKSFSQCIAISATDDATGKYHRYEFQYADMNDYPKFGVWPDGYYATYNMFRKKKVFLGAKACAFERAQMLDGKNARMVCFDLNGFGGVLPSDADSPPPAGLPNYLLNFGSDSLNVWRFHVDWLHPKQSTLSGPDVVDVLPFDPPCPLDQFGFATDCIAQGASTQPDQKLDALGDRLMYRLAFRSIGGQNLLVANHTVKAGTGSGIRLYELTIAAGGSVAVRRQQTFAPDGRFRWMGSAAMDKQGNVLVGYTTAGTDLFPTTRAAGYAADDGSVHDERTLVSGKAAQVSSNGALDRWGDYTTMTVDPLDDCTFWYTAQVQVNEGTFNWATRFGHVRFNNCH